MCDGQSSLLLGGSVGRLVSADDDVNESSTKAISSIFSLNAAFEADFSSASFSMIETVAAAGRNTLTTFSTAAGATTCFEFASFFLFMYLKALRLDRVDRGCCMVDLIEEIIEVLLCGGWFELEVTATAGFTVSTSLTVEVSCSLKLGEGSAIASGTEFSTGLLAQPLPSGLLCC